ncbi:hypothetical protein [Rhodanobacter thiooxydans]|nr:hypothetical protein [Rhodanobacter thiooxydans]UJJ56753.1 hypothetical protein LRK53_18220 [Rhodanobacter thiooxydans]
MLRLVLTAAFVVLLIVLVGALIGIARRAGDRRHATKADGDPGGGGRFKA